MELPQECKRVPTPIGIAGWFVALILAVGAAIASPVLFQENFDTVPHRFGDTLYYKLRPDTFGMAAAMSIPDSTKGAMASDSLEVAPLLGKKILLSAWTSAQNLSKRPQSWNGVKVMLIVTRSDGQTQYPQLAWPTDTSGWSWRRSATAISIPLDTRSVQILFGMEKSRGSVRFDSISLTTLTQAFVPPRDSALAIPRFSANRLRGAQISSGPGMAAVARFGTDWKGNLLRWQFGSGGSERPLSTLPQAAYDSILASHIANLDSYLPTIRANGIKIVLCMHNFSIGLFDTPQAQARLLATWRMLASHYRDSSSVWAYDLANEPDVDRWHKGVMDWNDLTDTLARAIREVDKNKVIVVESPVGDVSTFPRLRPVGATRGWDLENIAYSFHYYHPFTLTHQGIPNHPPLGAVYPGTIDGETWNAEKIRQDLSPALDFQWKYRVPIYVGEFSCVRWAANHSAVRWFADVLALFEEFQWDWTFHAYQEYDGWSVEYSDSPGDMRTPLETDRKALLVSYFARNKNPYDPNASARKTPSIPDILWLRTPTGLRARNVPAGAKVRLFQPNGKELVASEPGLFPTAGKGVLLAQTLQGPFLDQRLISVP